VTLLSTLHKLRVSVHAVWIGARDRDVTLLVRLFGLLVAAYALSPIDLIPDFIPIIGLLDDVILVPLGIWLFVKMIPPALHARHLAQAAQAGRRPVSRSGAALIILVWFLCALWVGRILWAKYHC
jgi:uncharacterized membrane protein YkvA (DUF1232 family)